MRGETTIKKDITRLLTNRNIPLRHIVASTFENPLRYDEKDREIYNLYPGHTDEEFNKWLSKMDQIEFTNGMAADFHFTLWLKDTKIWITREEDHEGYYGWWRIHERPPLPKKMSHETYS